MLELLFIPVLSVYLAILVLLFAWGANMAYLTLLAVRSGRRSPPSAEPAVWPVVTVQLPIFNELYVARRLIDAVARMEYPPDRLEIQVLDDSTDETSEIVATAVRDWQARGVDIRHVRRAGRDGFKAGALAYGLTMARGELIAIFDADFIPPPGFLRALVPVIDHDPGLAFVQSRWAHTNRRFSLLTRLQGISLDGHFAIEQAGRWGGGHWFNFNGTAGIWRRSAIVDAGGWAHDTLTEDLDLSYRAFLRGWRAAFVRDLGAPAELPVSFNAYRRQQHRWARGSFECAFKHLPAIWRAPVPMSRKVEATFHLSGYAFQLLLLLMSLLYPLVLLLATRYQEIVSLFGIMGVFNLTTLAPALLFTMGQRELRRNWVRELPTVLALSPFGAGTMVNTARAAWQALGNRPGVFERTPKFGIGHGRQDWRRLRYQLGFDRIVFVEAALAVLNAACCLVAISQASWAIALYTSIFCLGLSWAVVMTIGQTLRTALVVRREARAARRTLADGDVVEVTPEVAT